MSREHKGVRSKDTAFVRGIQWFFECVGDAICYAPWTFIIVSSLLTGLLTLVIPFTEMENNISDFTPYGARSRQELKVYEQFFSDRGEPKVIYAFIKAKNGTNLLREDCFNETIKVLDKINNDFYLTTPGGPRNFQQFCKGFCTFNEPVRNFAKGLILNNGSIGGTTHVDLGFPVTTVLGRKLFMDPNFFGVKIAVRGTEVAEETVDVSEATAIINSQEQLPNNIREINLIVLHFRGEIGKEINPTDLKSYEKQILDYFHSTKYESISVHILTDNFITSEIVRAGLTLLPFLVIGFTIMAIFATITFYISSKALGQWSFYKVVLAVMACSTPFMACGTTLGAMFLLGFRFGSILCVTPFLVLAIGVDDAFLMTNAWQRICHRRRKHNPLRDDPRADLRSRIREMLVETGPSVTITSLTNALAFGIGALTPTPEIQLFSIGNAVAVSVDFVFQLTIYAALMVVVGEREIAADLRRETQRTEEKRRENTGSTESAEKKDGKMKRILLSYCKLLTNRISTIGIMLLLGFYWYVSIVGTLNIKAELDPNKLFLEDSDIRKIFHARKEYISPNYATCWVLVNHPGDIRNPLERERLHSLVREFETLPPALGSYSTKFFLRDFDEFVQQSGEGVEIDPEDENSVAASKEDDLSKFLSWPEFSFWRGFVQTRNTSHGAAVERFFFTTAFHGSDFVDWSRRADLLNMWRTVADRHPLLNITVYEDDAKFLDLIETMVPTTAQSALLTFACMLVVAVLFISDPPTLFVATFSILSTSIGVFGIVSWWGAELDPILMSATVMSIGFSVDIPAHIGYHYFQTGKVCSSVVDRVEHTLNSVGVPIMQASISTILCVLSLFLVDLHMSQVFAKTMFLVVLIGAVHGMLVMPVLFNLISWVPRRRSKEIGGDTIESVVQSNVITISTY